MSLRPGTRLAHFEIIGSLGAGGMGEVYRARDSKLSREVALKILPPGVQSDPERRTRFAREARTLAALNHPHIAQVHGFEESGDTSVLVMELVEGEDLAQRLRRGPIPYDEAIAIARQIGDALQAAHDRGIVHRDLKPGNIKLRDDGTVKVLDFGLAKALDPGSGIGEPGAAEISNSPTITSPAMTMRGVILGTAAYMSPEQAKGRVVDKRADIWAFGCVLYEMLTGRKAFEGDDVSETLASVLKSDVNWHGVPAPAVRLLKKCFERDPRRRLHDVGDAWDLLDDGAAVEVRSRYSAWLPWTIAAVFAISTAALAWLWVTRPVITPPSARFQIEPPPKHAFEIYMALSPEGRRLAFTAVDAGNITLWVRDLESLEARQLPGTTGASSPFWSPDGRYLAFAVGQSLNKVDVGGGPVQKIADSPATVGMGAWNADGTIVFGTRGLGALHRVSATGGVPVAVTRLNEEAGERGHSFPVFLPDGRRFLYVRLSGLSPTQGIYAASIDKTPEQQESAQLVTGAIGPVALVTSPAGERLLFTRDGVLFAQPFDSRQLRVSGDAQPIAERVGSTGSFAHVAAAGDVLAFRTGRAAATNLEQLTWVGRNGDTISKVGEPLPMAPGNNVVAIAPDGRRAVLVLSQGVVPDLWLIEFARGLATRFTFTETGELSPAWSRDSRRIAYRGDRRGFDTLVKEVDGTSEETPIGPQPIPGLPSDWSPDGRFIVLVRNFDPNNADLLAISVEQKTVAPLLQTPFSEGMARLSPDGRWLAYVSNESGQSEVYIRPFQVGSDGKAGVGPKWRVSTSGGMTPRWRGDGKELFYRTAVGDFMAVDVNPTASTIETALPHRLFPNVFGVHGWDVASDGKRFLISIPLRSEFSVSPDPITVVLNWKTALARQ